MTITYIINPISGSGQKATIERAIKQQMLKSSDHISLRYTEYAGHAVEIAREEAERNTDVVVAVGGDGTVNEVARSLVHSSTALGIIPCGSGNGLARHLRIPMNIDKAMDLLREAYFTTIDYGTINSIPFFCTCGVGFDAFISMKFAQAGQRGLRTYVEKTLIDGIKYKPERYRISIDGVEEEQEAFLIACGNASQYGNNAYITPDASTRDGLLDVTILAPFTALDTPQIVMQMFNRKLEQNSHVKMFRTNHLRITRLQSGPVHVDGDPLNMAEVVDVSIVPKALRVIGNGHPGHRPVVFPRVQAFKREIEAAQHEIEATILRNFIEPFNSIDYKFWKKGK